MRTPNKSQKDSATLAEDKQHLKRGEQYTPDTTSEESETLWQKLWQHPEREEKPPARHQPEEVRTMVSEKSSESKPISHAQEREQHIKRAEHIVPYMPGKSWKRCLYQFWKWTGFSEKKGLDIAQVILLPVMLAVLGFMLNQAANTRQSNQAASQYRQEALVNYIDEINKVLYPLPAKDSQLSLSSASKSFVQAKTRSTLQLLKGDPERRDILITFLRDSGLLNRNLNQDRNFSNNPESKKNLDSLSPLLDSLSPLFERINLRSVDLRGADLRRAILKDAEITNADLRGIHLNLANLKYAFLAKSDLRSEDFTWLEKLNQKFTGKVDDTKLTTLIKANLRQAQLQEAKLEGANLRGANLIGANLDGVTWNIQTNFDHAIYSEQQLSKTTFPKNLSVEIKQKMVEIKPGMELKSKEQKEQALASADLSELNLRGATFSQVNLQDTDFTNSDLAGAMLTDAQLQNANLSQAKNLTKEQLSQSILCNTKLPAEIKLDKNRDCTKKPM